MDEKGFQRALGNKTLVTLGSRKKTYILIYSQSDFSQVFRVPFLQTMDSAALLQLDSFFLIWSCN